MNYKEFQSMRKQAGGASGSWDRPVYNNQRTFTEDMRSLGKGLVNDIKYTVNNPQTAARAFVNNPWVQTLSSPAAWRNFALYPFSEQAAQERAETLQRFKSDIRPYIERLIRKQQSNSIPASHYDNRLIESK